MSDNTLMHGFMADAARKAGDSYKAVLGAVLLVETAAAIALLIAPQGVSRLLGLGDDAGTVWPRVGGLLLFFFVAQMAVGRLMPAAAKAINVLGFVARALLGILLVVLGGRLMWIGGLWLIAAIILASFYFNYFKAEIMSRP